VPADIDTSEKNNESHPRIMKKKTNRRYGSLRYLRIVEGRICGQPYQTGLACWSTGEKSPLRFHALSG
jgi:hypothetical protein